MRRNKPIDAGAGGGVRRLRPAPTWVTGCTSAASSCPELLYQHLHAAGQLGDARGALPTAQTALHVTIGTVKETAEKATGARVLGKDPVSGKDVVARIGRFGPMIQIGSAEDEDKPKFASLRKDQSIQTITYEEEMDLFKLPRTLGELVRQMHAIGNKSILFIIVTLGFIGMVMTYEACLQLSRITGDYSQVGSQYIRLIVSDFGRWHVCPALDTSIYSASPFNFSCLLLHHPKAQVVYVQVSTVARAPTLTYTTALIVLFAPKSLKLKAGNSGTSSSRLLCFCLS